MNDSTTTTAGIELPVEGTPATAASCSASPQGPTPPRSRRWVRPSKGSASMVATC
ncbi:hypothetical protein [Brachybacterium sp. Z12]|uniref:hypothetical protein n=1 Tax=Brachybacterium sp. Z12 TaxID=2759167 RepID=UPI00223B9AE1|nr:hypothetical protein [Brachybacterium sp. Z12]